MSNGDFDNQGTLLANLVHFGRLLRQMGIPVSSQQISGMAEGIGNIDISQREDFYYTARAYLLYDIEKLDQFDLAFDLFWTKRMKAMLEFFVGHRAQEKKAPKGFIEDGNMEGVKSRFSSDRNELVDDQSDLYPKEKKVDPIYSSYEVIYRKDFNDLNDEELREAKAFLETLTLQLGQKRTQRKIRTKKQRAYFDFRRTIRNNLRYFGEIIKLDWQKRKIKPRPLVVICDISGSMERYSQMFLYFLYALAQRLRQIETFVFGTRLTRLTPALRQKDTHAVIDDLSDLIFDWSGGTRIGESLKDFNYHWSRRVLGHGAVIIIISDGWDRGDLDLLKREISRLQRSVNKLIWLNPLSGSPDYEPLVQGIQAVLPYVDDFLPLNNLQNLESLVMTLGTMD
jgi:uncharacterized protein with von Willebrand factor type A (vWA) domain